jgi:hypothetical protein
VAEIGIPIEVWIDVRHTFSEFAFYRTGQQVSTASGHPQAAQGYW